MKKHLLNFAIVLNMALIWGNSLMTGDASGAMSDGVLAWLGSFLPMVLTETGHTLLRKLAHFSEFALLGLLTGARQGTHSGAIRASLLGFGLAVGCVDETIQIFTPGRASSLLDVWIDFGGFALGTVILFVYHKFKFKGEQPS